MLGPGGDRPPVILVHGAAKSAGVWIHWQRALADFGWTSYAVDLRGHDAGAAVDLAATRMTDYADDVRTVLSEVARPAVLERRPADAARGRLFGLGAGSGRRARALPERAADEEGAERLKIL